MKLDICGKKINDNKCLSKYFDKSLSYENNFQSFKNSSEESGRESHIINNNLSGSLKDLSDYYKINSNHISLCRRDDMKIKGKKYNAILFEDTLFNIKLIQSLLEESMIDLDFAENGKVGIDKMKNKNKNYDLVLMDLQMPELDGFESSRIIREDLKLSVPIIAVTANNCEKEKIKCFEYGMNEYISKPFNPDKFYKILKKYLPKYSIKSSTTEEEKSSINNKTKNNSININSNHNFDLIYKRKISKKIFVNEIHFKEIKFSNNKSDIEIIKKILNQRKNNDNKNKITQFKIDPEKKEIKKNIPKIKLFNTFKTGKNNSKQNKFPIVNDDLSFSQKGSFFKSEMISSFISNFSKINKNEELIDNKHHIVNNIKPKSNFSLFKNNKIENEKIHTTVNESNYINFKSESEIILHESLIEIDLKTKDSNYLWQSDNILSYFEFYNKLTASENGNLECNFIPSFSRHNNIYQRLDSENKFYHNLQNKTINTLQNSPLKNNPSDHHRISLRSKSIKFNNRNYPFFIKKSHTQYSNNDSPKNNQNIILNSSIAFPRESNKLFKKIHSKFKNYDPAKPDSLSKEYEFKFHQKEKIKTKIKNSLIEYIGDDNECIKDVIKNFLKEFPLMKDNLIASIESNSTDDIKKSLHKIKSPLKLLGLDNFIEICDLSLEISSLEDYLNSNDILRRRINDEALNILHILNDIIFSL